MTQYRTASLNRRIDAEGYVSMQQHRGMAGQRRMALSCLAAEHGQGFHFSTDGEVWAIQSLALEAAHQHRWLGDHGRGGARGIDAAAGLRLNDDRRCGEI